MNGTALLGEAPRAAVRFQRKKRDEDGEEKEADRGDVRE